MRRLFLRKVFNLLGRSRYKVIFYIILFISFLCLITVAYYTIVGAVTSETSIATFDAQINRISTLIDNRKINCNESTVLESNNSTLVIVTVNIVAAIFIFLLCGGLDHVDLRSLLDTSPPSPPRDLPEIKFFNRGKPGEGGKTVMTCPKGRTASDIIRAYISSQSGQQ
jgi:hypothetical protein